MRRARLDVIKQYHEGGLHAWPRLDYLSALFFFYPWAIDALRASGTSWQVGKSSSGTTPLLNPPTPSPPYLPYPLPAADL